MRRHMGTPTSVDKHPAHWRQCADQALRAADQETDPTTRKTLQEIAEAYENLAALAEAKLTSWVMEAALGRSQIGRSIL
jgi:uncharacterized membrane protein